MVQLKQLCLSFNTKSRSFDKSAPVLKQARAVSLVGFEEKPKKLGAGNTG